MFRQHPKHHDHDLEIDVTDDAAPDRRRRAPRTARRAHGVGWSAMVATSTVAVGLLAVQVVGTGTDDRRGDAIDATAAAPDATAAAATAPMAVPLAERTVRVDDDAPSDAERAAYISCMAGRRGTADTLERYARTCTSEAETTVALDERVTACLQRSVGTPDALERWVEPCRARAVREVEERQRYDECMSNVPHSADAADRWADSCR